MNEEPKRTEFDRALCKKFKVLVYTDFLHFSAIGRKLVEKMIHQKKNGGHRTSKIVKCWKSYNNDHLPGFCTQMKGSARNVCTSLNV